MTRVDGRQANEIRLVTIVPGVNPYAEGSAEVSFGQTKVLITVSIEKEVPPWMKPGQGGWITAEYGMLPRATHSRSRREASAGKQSGRTLEIQRIIGRALRQGVSLKDLEGLTFKIDCDVICADGGTRTAAITGAWVALSEAIRKAAKEKLVRADLSLQQVAAVSVGRVAGSNIVDLCYAEDSSAEFDLNLVFDQQLRLIEIQGTAEREPLTGGDLSQLIALGEAACRQLFENQRRSLRHG